MKNSISNSRKIFFDNDECLCHCSFYRPAKFDFLFRTGNEKYFCRIRRGALEALATARELVDRENVYMLTMGMERYAHKVNKLANFGFRDDQIIAREDILTRKNHGLDHPDNILIDNLYFADNLEKTLLMKVKEDNYIKVPDFLGKETEGFDFEKFVVDKLSKLL